MGLRKAFGKLLPGWRVYLAAALGDALIGVGLADDVATDDFILEN